MGANISLFTLLQVDFYRVSFDNILISVNKMTSFFLTYRAVFHLLRRRKHTCLPI